MNNLKIIKRDGSIESFNISKIETAIVKSMRASEVVDNDIAVKIAREAMNFFNEETTTVNRIEEYVYGALIKHDLPNVARAYEAYRAVQEYKRENIKIDKNISKLLSNDNAELKTENSNKNPIILSTGRDYVAGEFSKDYMRRIALPAQVTTAHDLGMIHYHDLDYAMQPMINCCLINIGDMLDNGTVLNGKMYESPATFEKACGIVAQVIAQISGNQYGGNSINIKHLGKYLKKSYDRHKLNEIRKQIKYYKNETAIDEKIIEAIAMEETKKTLRAGIRSLLFQINGFTTLSGQAPFCTLFLEMDFGGEYEEFQAMVIEEIIDQRYNGMKNEKGVYVSPAFPKLIFVLDEFNMYPMTKYYYLKKKSIQCSAKRLVPDYISAKKMRELYEGNIFSPMGCRSKLSVWRDENGVSKFEGRFNMGVVSLNLVQIAILADRDEKKFFDILQNRLEICKEALMFRYEWLKDTKSDVSPIHWQNGALARLEKGESINKLLENGYGTISLGYIGVYEMTKLMKNVSHTNPEGSEFALKVMRKLRATVDGWKEETGLGFGLYGTPSEGLCHRLCQIDKSRFGIIKDITDKGWYTNSFHRDVREEVDAFEKLRFEAQFQEISSGGFISYIEVPNMTKNLEALEQVIDFGYETTVYFEINTKSDYCYDCGFDGEMLIKDEITWYCPNCENDDFDKLHIVRRTCGYVGENGFNEGKTKEIAQRVLHL